MKECSRCEIHLTHSCQRSDSANDRHPLNPFTLVFFILFPHNSAFATEWRDNDTENIRARRGGQETGKSALCDCRKKRHCISQIPAALPFILFSLPLFILLSSSPSSSSSSIPPPITSLFALSLPFAVIFHIFPRLDRYPFLSPLLLLSLSPFYPLFSLSYIGRYDCVCFFVFFCRTIGMEIQQRYYPVPDRLFSPLSHLPVDFFSPSSIFPSRSISIGRDYPCFFPLAEATSFLRRSRFFSPPSSSRARIRGGRSAPVTVAFSSDWLIRCQCSAIRFLLGKIEDTLAFAELIVGSIPSFFLSLPLVDITRSE